MALEILIKPRLLLLGFRSLLNNELSPSSLSPQLFVLLLFFYSPSNPSSITVPTYATSNLIRSPFSPLLLSSPLSFPYKFASYPSAPSFARQEIRQRQTDAMDIALEIWDSFIGDRLYSALLPVSLTSSVSVPGFANAANSTLALFGASQPFVYEPATQLIYLEPSKYAYMSAWPRNNIYRQFLSFFLIVWYVTIASLLPELRLI